MMSKEIPLVILSSLAFAFMSSDILIDGSSANVISRVDGCILLCFFMIFMRYTFAIAHNQNASEAEEKKVMGMGKATLFILAGLVGLVVGGQLFVVGASNVARNLGVSESVIGLTLVAGGTSLPELATSVVAALKKNSGIAIGNVIGSCLFNIFFVLGCSATILPLSMGEIGLLDVLVLLGSSVLFWLVGWFFKERTITRMEGVLMVACYVAYTSYLIALQ